MIDKDKIIVKLYLKTEDQAEALVSLQKQYDEVKAENAKLRGQHAQVLAKESAQNTLKADLDMLRSQVSQLKSQNGELERALKETEFDDDEYFENYVVNYFAELEGDYRPYYGKGYDGFDITYLYQECVNDSDNRDIDWRDKNSFKQCLLNIGFAHDIDWVVTKEAMQRIRPN